MDDIGKMNILLTGFSGFLGTKVMTAIHPNYNLTLVGRTPPTFECASKATFYKRNISHCTDYSKALDDIDCIIHCAARVHIMSDRSKDPLNEYREVNTIGTINLAEQAVQAGVKRFIFISSIKVNGETTLTGEPFSHESPCFPKDFYGQSKLEAEEQLLKLANETGLEVVIIRPTLVYGAGVKANFESLMNLVSTGIPLPFASIKNNRRSLVSVTNLVDLIITCIEHPKATNQVFLVSDDNDISTSGMIIQMSKSLGKTSLQIPMPVFLYKLLGKLVNKEAVVERLTGSLQVDINHTKETLNWKPPQSLEDGFKETAEAFLRSKRK